jgi:hypothetical protein
MKNKNEDLKLLDDVIFSHNKETYCGTIVKMNPKSFLISYIPNTEEAKRIGIFVESTVRKSINESFIKINKGLK